MLSIYQYKFQTKNEDESSPVNTSCKQTLTTRLTIFIYLSNIYLQALYYNNKNSS